MAVASFMVAGHTEAVSVATGHQRGDSGLFAHPQMYVTFDNSSSVSCLAAGLQRVSRQGHIVAIRGASTKRAYDTDRTCRHLPTLWSRSYVRVHLCAPADTCQSSNCDLPTPAPPKAGDTCQQQVPAPRVLVALFAQRTVSPNVAFHGLEAMLPVIISTTAHAVGLAPRALPSTGHLWRHSRAVPISLYQAFVVGSPMHRVPTPRCSTGLGKTGGVVSPPLRASPPFPQVYVAWTGHKAGSDIGFQFFRPVLWLDRGEEIAAVGEVVAHGPAQALSKSTWTEWNFERVITGLTGRVWVALQFVSGVHLRGGGAASTAGRQVWDGGGRRRMNGLSTNI